MRVVVFVLILLIIINTIGLSKLFYSRNDHSSVEYVVIREGSLNGSSQSYYGEKKSSNSKDWLNRISIDFNIMDVYRIDMSCDYIITALSGKISEKYKNKKLCALSSLNKDVDRKLLESFDPVEGKNYEPKVSPTIEFDPFKETKPNPNIEQYLKLKPGGLYEPQLKLGQPICNEKNIDNIVFIVPYTKSRQENLRLFLLNMHQYLQAQTSKFKYRILVVEQNNFLSKPFNKGKLYNTAVRFLIDNIINKQDEIIDCIVLHDVDLIPSKSANKLGELGDYRCRQMPWHMSRRVKNLGTNQESFYNAFLTGGILSMRLDHFIDVNGFSNEYSGWGGKKKK